MPFTDSIKTVDVIIADKEILDATPEKVLTGTKFIGKTQHIETGSIPINQERTSDIILGNGETFNIPFGYNPLAYNITVSSLEDNTFGTATPADIIYDKTAWVNGVKITGTMPVVSSEEIEPEDGFFIVPFKFKKSFEEIYADLPHDSNLTLKVTCSKDEDSKLIDITGGSSVDLALVVKPEPRATISWKVMDEDED